MCSHHDATCHEVIQSTGTSVESDLMKPPNLVLNLKHFIIVTENDLKSVIIFPLYLLSSRLDMAAREKCVKHKR
jgi:hypothetical protein